MRYLSIMAIALLVAGCAGAPPKTEKTTVPKIPDTLVAAPQPSPTPCDDGDQDGVCDADDRCPMKDGPVAAFGCPIDPCGGSPLLVLVQFEYDSSQMPARKVGVQTMDPVLEKVAEAIAKDSSCRVCIIGHASEEGSDEYNEELSRRRASAVQSYMIEHDLAEARLPVTGLGERCQLDAERTRSLNRRVEFRRLQEGQSCPTDCSK